MKKNNESGFTLVELVVVVAIFGIIMGAALNLMKPMNEMYRKNKTTMETNTTGTGLVNYIDKELRYATNIVVLKDYKGVPVASNVGNQYTNVLILDNNNPAGYSTTGYTPTAIMGETGQVIKCSIVSGEINIKDSAVAMGKDAYDKYLYDFEAYASDASGKSFLNFNMKTKSASYYSGAYHFDKVEFEKKNTTDLININSILTFKSEGTFAFDATAPDYGDYSPGDYTTYPIVSTPPAGLTTEQQSYYGTSNAYTYVFYSKY